MPTPSTEPGALRLSHEEWKARKRRIEADPWLFSKYVCKHAAKAVERIHRPLLYLYTRRAELLIATLDDPRFEGEVTAQVREDFRANGIDWSDPAHLPRVRRRLRRVNIRMPRGSGKSTFADDGDLWDFSVDPNMTIGLASKSDPYAESRIEAMGLVMQSPEYAFWFPERIPQNLKTDVTQSAIKVAGRTEHVIEASIEGRGATSQWTGYHYRKLRRDDIVGTEAGEASLEDALAHMAQTNSLRNVLAFEGEVYIGTVNGENDDHSIMADDPDCLNVVMPIERHEDEVTLETLMTPGTPTMPEWGSGEDRFDRDGIDKIKRDAMQNKTQGPVWLLQNYYMVAHKAGSGAFTKQLLKRSQFLSVPVKALNRHVIMRPKKGREDTPRDHAHFRKDDWFILDLKTLPKSAFAWAGDQSVAEGKDRWALAWGCIDWEGVFYLLDLEVGDTGYDAMLDALIPFDRRAGKPPKNGLDANATQRMTIDFIKRSAEFKALERRVVGVTSNNEAKDVNIHNYIKARMRMGDFYYDPRLHEFTTEALRYRPRTADGRKRRNPVDDVLDATWMMTTLPVRPPAPQDLEREEAESMLMAMRERRHQDPVTGMDSGDWMQYLWSNDAA